MGYFYEVANGGEGLDHEVLNNEEEDIFSTAPADAYGIVDIGDKEALKEIEAEENEKLESQGREKAHKRAQEVNSHIEDGVYI